MQTHQHPKIIRQHQQRSSSYSLLFFDLHREAFHVCVFKVKAEVLPAEAQVGGHAVCWGLGEEMDGEIRGEEVVQMNSQKWNNGKMGETGKYKED